MAIVFDFDRTFCPFPVIYGDAISTTAVIVLNSTNIHLTPSCIDLWNKAEFRACTDGAANYLRDRVLSDSTVKLPHLVSGDFDSITVESRQFFESKKCQVQQTFDQEFTDFTKCLMLLLEIFDAKQVKIDQLVAFGGLMGRFDQTLANLQSLFLFRKKSDKPLYIFDSSNLIMLIPEGKTSIEIDMEKCTGFCGLVPIGQPASKVTTNGLKWNLSNEEVAYGKRINTSNMIMDSMINIDTESPLIWTMELKE